MSNSVGGCDHVEGSTSKKRSKERRSEVWIHFDKTLDNKNAICKYCDKSMVAESKNGTSSLKRHIEACKKRPQDVDQPVTMGIRDGSTSKKRSSEGPSAVWIHFNKTPDNKRAICKYCDKSMAAESKNGTSSLKRHIEACKKRPQDVDRPVTMGIQDGSTSKKRSSEGPSAVWIHFNKTPDNKRAICKYCDKSMAAESKNGTSSLKRHIEACKKRQQGADQPVTMGIRDEVRKFDWANKSDLENELKKAIILEVPFVPSNTKKFYSQYMGSIDLDKEIGLYYEQEKKKLANELKHLTSQVCFSYEIMVEVELNLNYISITSHFINEDFHLVHKLIGFKKLSDISESCVVHTIEKCISDWELGNKIFSFTGEDHSEYVRLLKQDFYPIMSLDGPYFHLPCYKKGLTSVYSSSLFRLCCNLIWNLIESMKAVRCHMDAFNESAKERGLPPINEDWLNLYGGSDLDLDCPDPGLWERVVKMFKEAILYEGVIGNCSMGHDIDWERFEVVVKFSDKVREIIDTMASFNYPMFNLYFRNHAEIEDILSKKEDYAITIRHWFHDPFWNSNYYCKENKIIFVACALDPRYKLSFLKHYSENIAKRNRPEFTEYTNEIYKFLENFFGKYKVKTAESANPQEGCTNNSAHLNPIIDGFSMYTKELKKTAPKSELEEYLDDEKADLHDASFNLLDWWKHNRLRYPVLSKMARDVLAVPTSVYSIKGNMISDLRTFEGVSPQLVEAVFCSKDWIINDVQRVPESNN